MKLYENAVQRQQKAQELLLRVNARMLAAHKEYFTISDYQRIMQIPYTKEGGERVMDEILELSKFGMLNEMKIKETLHFQVELFREWQVKNMRNNLKAARISRDNITAQIEQLKKQIGGFYVLEQTLILLLPPDKAKN